MCRVFGFSQLQFCLGVMGGKRKSNDGTSAASGKAKAIKNDSTASAVNHEYVKLFEDWLNLDWEVAGGSILLHCLEHYQIMLLPPEAVRKTTLDEHQSIDSYFTKRFGSEELDWFSIVRHCEVLFNNPASRTLCSGG